MKLIIESLISSVLLILITKLLPGAITYQSYLSIFIVFLLFNLVNLFIRPIINILTLPINILTLGIFGFIVYVLLFIICSNIVPGFEVVSFWNTAIILIILGILQPMVRKLVE